VPDKLLWMLAIAFVAVAGWWDWKTRRVPNWLTVPALIAGLVIHTVLTGWAGAKSGLEGAGVGLGLLLPFVLLRGLGAGDWKLVGALGAFVGPRRTIEILLISVMIAGVIAGVDAIRRGRVIATVRNVWTLLQGFFVFGLRPNPTISLDNPTLARLPFAVAVAAATVISFGFAGIIF